MKPIDVESDSFAEYNEKSNEKDTKFKVGDHVRISKYKNIFKDMLLIGKKIFTFKKVKILFLVHMYLMILMGKKSWEVFMKKNCRKLIKKNLELTK